MEKLTVGYVSWEPGYGKWVESPLFGRPLMPMEVAPQPHTDHAKEAGDSTFVRRVISFDELQPKYHPPKLANDNLPRVIGLSGPAGSGKSTAAQYLVSNFGYRRVRFAGPLKAMAAAAGLSDREIEGDLKELPSELLCGRTPRYFMQRLGTEFGRDLIGEDFWVNLWRESANAIIDGGGRVVADDCRFENEVDMLRSLGGIVGVLRGRGGLAAAHSSEAYVPVPDFVLSNSGEVNSLHLQLATLLRHAA